MSLLCAKDDGPGGDLADAASGAVFDLLSELGGNDDEEEPGAEEVGDAAPASAGDAAPAATPPPATNTRAGFFQ